MIDFEKLIEDLAKIPPVKGVSPVDVLALPDPLGGLIRKMTRKKTMTLEDLAGEMDLTREETRQIGDLLVEKGYLRAELRHTEDNLVYRVYYARMRKRNIPLDL